MSAEEVLGQLRRFLLVLSVLLFCGAIIELWLVGHTEDPNPVARVCTSRPRRNRSAGRVDFSTHARSVRFLRICMTVVVLGSLFGIYEHVTGNIAFEREIHPDMSTGQAVWKGLQGANPLLAPGILAIAALLALSATYRNEITASNEQA